MPDRVSTTWQTHQWNIAADHRCAQSGIGGVYGRNSSKTVLAEVATHYGLANYIADGSRIFVKERFELKNVLDLTDSKIRSQLGVELSDLTENSYATSEWRRQMVMMVF